MIDDVKKSNWLKSLGKMMRTDIRVIVGQELIIRLSTLLTSIEPKPIR